MEGVKPALVRVTQAGSGINTCRDHAGREAVKLSDIIV